MKFSIAFFTRLFLLGILLPTLFSAVVYQGFSSNYTVRVFSEQSFKRQYESGIYKYRLLGRVLLMETYQRVQHYDLPTIAPFALKQMDERGDRDFYSAYFYLNTFFLSLTCLVFFFMFSGHKPGTDFLTTDLPVLFLMSVMTLSQYVIVPYDMLTYFLLSVAAWLMMQNDQRLWHILALCAVVVLGALTRETAALMLSFYFAWNYKEILTRPRGFRFNRAQAALLLLMACFVATSMGLRLALGQENAVFESLIFQFGYDLSTTSGMLAVAGIAFLVGVMVLFFLSSPRMPQMWVFVIAALPYLIPMLLIANPWEIRLWVPVILLLTLMKMSATQGGIPPATS